MSHLLHSGSFLKHSCGPLDSDPDPDFEKVWAALPEPHFHRKSSAKVLPTSPIQKPVAVRPSKTGPTISSKWLFKPVDYGSAGVEPQESTSTSSSEASAEELLPPPPSPPLHTEVRIGVKDHAGNEAFRRIVREFLIQQVHSTDNLALPKYTPALYMEMVKAAKKQTPGIEFVVPTASDKKSFRPATTKEKIDYVRTCYEDMAVEAATAPPVAFITANWRPL